MKTPLDYLAGTHEAIEEYISNLDEIEANLKEAIIEVQKMRANCMLVEIDIRNMFKKEVSDDSSRTQ